ncbi:hypothetical protein BSZ37_05620 [Rubrivirga marina]|uniref:Uncharacterized protein n=2 Tax=Rubrivirga marina TaxID=1196024 RepID=A0A271IYS2_9BACT|nr:hypothetical protein BSZ37_05620 [Rubrivirga marina]
MMEQGRPGEALEAYERSLDLYPRRFNGLLGAARAARELGEPAAARAFYTELVESSADGSTREGLAEARAFLSASPH